MAQQEPQKTPLVIPIDAPRVHSVLSILNPEFKAMEYEDIHNKYLVMDWPANGQYVLMNAEQLNRNFDTRTIRGTWFFQPFVVDVL